MGVPGYFARAARAAPHAVGAEQPVAAAALYVDFNCLVHRQVRGGGGQAAQDVIDRALAYLERDLLGACRLLPGARVLVAADGPPPLAKMMQQRGRRFIARYKCPLTAPGGISPSATDPFERSDITPGTPFAARLDAAAALWCERANANAGAGLASFEYSGTSEPGEGEHKIMRAMRLALSGGERPGPSLVYGLDADLLLLTMLHGARTGDWPAVVREADALGREGDGGAAMRFVDIRAITAAAAGGLDRRRVRNHVVCSFLCGNDFLPPASCLSVQDGWTDLLRAASEDLDLAPDDAATGGVAVDPRELARLLARLAAREDADFFRADRRYWDAAPPGRARDAEEAWNSYPLLHKDGRLRSVRPGSWGWRPRFYGSVMGIRHPEDVEGACRLFLAGVAWCAAYYSGGLGPPGGEPSWFYPHHYGPTSADLANAAAGGAPGTARVPCDEDGFPALRFTPEMVRRFVVPGSPAPPPDHAAYLFPTEFRLATYLRHRVWHCAAELPFPLDVSRDVCHLHSISKKMGHL